MSIFTTLLDALFPPKRKRIEPCLVPALMLLFLFLLNMIVENMEIFFLQVIALYLRSNLKETCENNEDSNKIVYNEQYG